MIRVPIYVSTTNMGLFSNVSQFMIIKNVVRPGPAHALPSESLQASDATCAGHCCAGQLIFFCLFHFL